MTTPTPAVDLLRRAAEKLRAAAAGTSPAPWEYNSYSAIFSVPKLREYDEWDSGDHSCERRGRCEVCNRNGCDLAGEEYRRGPIAAKVPASAGDSAHGEFAANATYIALMHPPVALAVADWLEMAAQLRDGADLHPAVTGVVPDYAVAVARAVLREDGAS